MIPAPSISRWRITALTLTAWILLPVLISSCGGGSADHHDHHGHDHGHSHAVHDGHDHDYDHHGHEGHSHDAEGTDEDARAGHSDEIILSPEKAKAAGVEAEVIRPGEFHEVIPTSGRILASPGGEASAVATRAGIVTLSRPWTEGMAVSQGTPLFTISASRLPEGDVSRRSAVEFNRTKAEFERISKLYEEKLATASDYENAKSAYETARISYEATGSGKTGGATVTAPKAGYVLSCLVKDGDYVDVGTPMMTITQNRRLRLQADLPMREYASAGNIRSANFRLGGDDGSFSTSDLNGTVVSVGRSTDGSSTFVPVTFEFDNAPGIVSGAFAEVYLIGAPRQGVLSVPREALSEDQGVHYIYIQVDEEGYRRRQVSVGKSDGRRVEITSGLQPGERVVTRGAVHVRLASASKAIPGHTHNH
ncbi:MAG: efflux RND transporter periplasmic adaptor subunit [Bacteroides sp.]|nr:efflux RND transporter periplasmic adaptor subunit [Bacteroides sp.]